MNSPHITASATSTTAPRSKYVIDCAGAWITVHARSLAAVLTIDGEIDAVNTEAFHTAVRRYGVLHSPVIVDLTTLDFLGVGGFRSLMTLSQEYQQADLPFIVVPGAALRLLLRVFTDHDLITEPSVTQALKHITEIKRAPRQILLSMARTAPHSFGDT